MEIETDQPNTDVSIDINGIDNGNNDKLAPKPTINTKKVPTYKCKGGLMGITAECGRIMGLHF